MPRVWSTWSWVITTPARDSGSTPTARSRRSRSRPLNPASIITVTPSACTSVALPELPLPRTVTFTSPHRALGPPRPASAGIGSRIATGETAGCAAVAGPGLAGQRRDRLRARQLLTGEQPPQLSHDRARRGLTGPDQLLPTVQLVHANVPDVRRDHDVRAPGGPAFGEPADHGEGLHHDREHIRVHPRPAVGPVDVHG